MIITFREDDDSTPLASVVNGVGRHMETLTVAQRVAIVRQLVNGGLFDDVEFLDIVPAPPKAMSAPTFVNNDNDEPFPGVSR